MNPNKPEIPELNRKPIRRMSGEDCFHGLSSVRFVTELPASVKGPIRAREYRRGKDPNATAIGHHGTPQLNAEDSPPRD